MAATTQSLPHTVAPQQPASRHAGKNPMAHWLLRCWQAACRRAERPDRFVPYF